MLHIHCNDRPHSKKGRNQTATENHSQACTCGIHWSISEDFFLSVNCIWVILDAVGDCLSGSSPFQTVRVNWNTVSRYNESTTHLLKYWSCAKLCILPVMEIFSFFTGQDGCVTWGQDIYLQCILSFNRFCHFISCFWKWTPLLNITFVGWYEIIRILKSLTDK